VSEPIENDYFNWLCAKVLDPTQQIYRKLLWVMHHTEFVYTHPMDQNRAMDGLELRTYFVDETGISPDPSWPVTGCSVFEMLLALTRHTEFQTEMSAREWFWLMVQNLNLDEYRHVSEEDVPYIQDVLERFIWRTYSDDGRGGIFPLRWPKRDQRGVEIWYQFFDYLEDQGLM
jgi:hypothetical protein